MTPAHVLPLAEMCAESRELQALVSPADEGGRRALWRTAIQSGVQSLADAAGAARFLPAHRALLAALPPRVAMTVTDAVSNHFEEVRKGLIPTVHRFAYGLDMDIDGLAPGKREPTVGLRPDCLWNETTGEGVATAVVLQHDIDLDATPDSRWPELDLLAAGLAWAVANDVERMRVGRIIHAIGKPVRYQWSAPMGDPEMQVILARVRRALTAARSPSVGLHCYRCDVSQRCAAWMLPAVQGAHSALRPLQENGTGIDKHNVEQVRRVATAMRSASDAALFQVREYDLRTGAANDNALTPLQRETVEAVRKWT